MGRKQQWIRHAYAQSSFRYLPQLQRQTLPLIKVVCVKGRRSTLLFGGLFRSVIYVQIIIVEFGCICISPQVS